MMMIHIQILILTALFLHFSPTTIHSLRCRNFCNNIPIRYPFGIDDGCGAPLFRPMFNCSTTELFFLTPSGSYKVQTIDYNKQTLIVYDPSMSTCSILQPHHDFLMTDIQAAIIPPSPDTIFALVNCSIDSPVLNHYKSLCFNFSGHSCDELYSSCTSFKFFRMPSTSMSNSSGIGTGTGTGAGTSTGIVTGTGASTSTPPCCFTRYDTVKMMSMNILDCTHYTSVYNVDGLKGVAPLDWLYGMKLSYSLPDLGCERCAKSGGTCGFDVETKGFLCICSATNTNSTRDCGLSENRGEGRVPSMLGPGGFISVLFFLLANS